MPWRALFISLALWCAMPWARAQTSLRDDRGEVLVLPVPPARIVSLLPSLTETVCTLGGCGRLVGTDRYSNWPAQVGQLPKLGGLDDTSIEAIVALRPDVVLLSNASRLAGRLQALGIPCAALRSDNRQDARRDIEFVAQLLGDPEAGRALWARIERDTLAAAARVPAAWRGKSVYFEVDPTPYGAGPASFIGQTLQSLGLQNALPASLGAYPRLNPELLLRLQPDLLMAGQATLSEMGHRPGWPSLRALREGRTCAFDGNQSDLLVRPGPRMGEGAAAIADCLVSIAKRAPLR